MGDHDDLPNCRKFLQLGRLQKQHQPLEQLDAAIEEIRRLMLRSERTANKERLSRKEEAAAVATTTTRWSGRTAPKDDLGSRRISTSEMGSS
jgi:hypothetical protein